MISSARQHERIYRAGLRRGFTLVEMVVTVAILSVIMLGMGSAMIIATRALPEADNPAAAAIAAASAAERLAAELQYAVSINDSNATAIEFTVADRNHDDVPETIRYEWSGTPGDPLTRQYNGGTPYEALADVSQFNLTYDLQSISVEIPQANESAETTLAGYGSAQDLHDYPIKDTEWYAQYFWPTLPADATSWKVTRVVIYAKADGPSDGEARVQLQPPTAGNCPTGIVLQENTLLESTLLETYAAQEFSFSNAAGLSPEQGLCIVVKWTANGTACKVHGQDKNMMGPRNDLAKSSNRGASWSLLTDQSLLFSVYGTVSTAGEPDIQDTYHLGGADVTLRMGGDAQSTVQTSVRLLNRPEVIQ
jgi:prepilin-type N-terminal cleavage/methylation domain-containing protein